jgi:hypothetical protein
MNPNQPNIIAPGQGDEQPGQPIQQPASTYFPPNQAALQAEQQQQALAVNPAVQQVLGSNGFQSQKPVKWIVSVALLAILLVSASGFSYWAFTERQKYKNDTDKIVAAAVAQAEKKTTEKNNEKFAEELKNPLTNYTGPSSYGTISVGYPKTWSAYVSTGTGSKSEFEAYFHPKVVPAVSTGSTGKAAVAVHIQVTDDTYDEVVSDRESSIKSGKLTAAPYALPKNAEQVGVVFTGELASKLSGREIVLPLRDKAIVITFETDEYLNDIEKYILPNLTFIP